MSNSSRLPGFGLTARSPYDLPEDEEDWQSDTPAAVSFKPNAADTIEYMPPMDRRRLFDESLSDADLLAMQEQFMRSGAVPSATMFRRQNQTQATDKPSHQPIAEPVFERRPVNPAQIASLGIPTRSITAPDHEHPSRILRRGVPSQSDIEDDFAEEENFSSLSRSTGGEIAPSAVLIRAPKPVGGIGKIENARLAVSSISVTSDRGLFRPVQRDNTGEWAEASAEQEVVFTSPSHTTATPITVAPAVTSAGTVSTPAAPAAPMPDVLPGAVSGAVAGAVVARERPRKNKPATVSSLASTAPHPAFSASAVPGDGDSDSDMEEADCKKILGGLVPLLPSVTTTQRPKTDAVAGGEPHEHAGDGSCEGHTHTHTHAPGPSTGTDAGTGMSAEALTAAMTAALGAVSGGIVERRKPKKNDKVAVTPVTSENVPVPEKIEIPQNPSHPDAVVVRERPRNLMSKGRKLVASGGFPESTTVVSSSDTASSHPINNDTTLSKTDTISQNSKPSLFSQRRKLPSSTSTSTSTSTPSVTLDSSLFPPPGRKLTQFARQRLNQARAAANLPPIAVDQAGVVLPSGEAGVGGGGVMYMPPTPAVEAPHMLQPVGGRGRTHTDVYTASTHYPATASSDHYTSSSTEPLPAYTASHTAIGGVAAREFAADADSLLSSMSEKEKVEAASELIGSLPPHLVEVLRKRRAMRAAEATSGTHAAETSASAPTSTSAPGEPVVIDYTGSTATPTTLPHELVPQLRRPTATMVKVVGEDVKPLLNDNLERRKAAWLLPVSEKENKLVGSGKKIPVDTTTTLPKTISSGPAYSDASATTQRPHITTQRHVTDAADGVSERAALAETGVPSSLSVDWANWRVDLDGALANDEDTRRELLHHGAQPGRAGYTLHELGQLARSTHAGQRSMAAGVLAKVIVRARAQMYVMVEERRSCDSGSGDEKANAEAEAETGSDGRDYSHLVLSYLFVRLQIVPLVRALLDDATATVNAAAALCLLTLLEPVPGLYSGISPTFGQRKSGGNSDDDVHEKTIVPYTDASLSGNIFSFEIPEQFPNISFPIPVHNLVDVRKVSFTSTRPISAAVVAAQHIDSCLEEEGVLDKLASLRQKYTLHMDGRHAAGVNAADEEEEEEERQDKKKRKEEELELDQLSTFDIVATLLPMSILPRLRYLLASQLPLTDSVGGHDDKINKSAETSSLHTRLSSTLSHQCILLSLIYCIAAHSPRAALLVHFTPYIYDCLRTMAITSTIPTIFSAITDNSVDDSMTPNITTSRNTTSPPAQSAQATAQMQSAHIALLRARRTTWLCSLLSCIASVEGSLALSINASSIPSILHAAISQIAEDVDACMRRYPSSIASGMGILASLRSAVAVARLLRVLVHNGVHTGEILSLHSHMLPIFSSWPQHYTATGMCIVPALKTLCTQLHGARLTLCSAVVAVQETMLGRGAHVYLLELEQQQRDNAQNEKNTNNSGIPGKSVSSNASITLSHGAMAVETVTSLLAYAAQQTLAITISKTRKEPGNSEKSGKWEFTCTPGSGLDLWTRGDSLFLSCCLNYAAAYLALIPTHSQFGAPALTALTNTASSTAGTTLAGSGVASGNAGAGAVAVGGVSDSVLVQLTRLQRTATRLLQPLRTVIDTTSGEDFAINTSATAATATTTRDDESADVRSFMVPIGALHLGVAALPCALRHAVRDTLAAYRTENARLCSNSRTGNGHADRGNGGISAPSLLVLSRKDAPSPISGNSVFRNSTDFSDPSQVLSRLDFPSLPTLAPLRYTPSLALEYHGEAPASTSTSPLSAWLQSDAHPLAFLATILDLHEPSLTQAALRLLRAAVEVDRLVYCHTWGGVPVAVCRVGRAPQVSEELEGAGAGAGAGREGSAEGEDDRDVVHVKGSKGEMDENMIICLHTVNTNATAPTPIATCVDADMVIQVARMALLTSLGHYEALIDLSFDDNIEKLSSHSSTLSESLSLPFPEGAMTIAEATMTLRLLLLSPIAGSVINLHDTLYSQQNTLVSEKSQHIQTEKIPKISLDPCAPSSPLALSFSLQFPHLRILSLAYAASYAALPALLASGSLPEATFLHTHVLTDAHYMLVLANGPVESACVLDISLSRIPVSSPCPRATANPTPSSIAVALRTLHTAACTHAQAIAPLLAWCLDADALKKSSLTRALMMVEQEAAMAGTELCSPLLVQSQEGENITEIDGRKEENPEFGKILEPSLSIGPFSLTIQLPLLSPCAPNPTDTATHLQKVRMHLTHLPQSVTAITSQLPWTASLALQRCAAVYLIGSNVNSNDHAVLANAAHTVLQTRKTQNPELLGPIIPNPSFFPSSSPILVFLPSSRLSVSLSPLAGTAHMGWAASPIRIMQELHQVLTSKLETDKNKAITATQTREGELQQQMEQVMHLLANTPAIPEAEMNEEAGDSASENEAEEKVKAKAAHTLLRKQRMRLLSSMQAIREEITSVQQQLDAYLKKIDEIQLEREEVQVKQLCGLLHVVNIMGYLVLQGVRVWQGNGMGICGSRGSNNGHGEVVSTILHHTHAILPPSALYSSTACPSQPYLPLLSRSAHRAAPPLPLALALRACLHTAAHLVYLTGYNTYQHPAVAPHLRATVAMSLSPCVGMPLEAHGAARGAVDPNPVVIDVSGLPLANLTLALGWRGPMSVGGKSALQALLSHSHLHASLYSRFADAVAAFAADSAGDPGFSYLLLAFAATHLPRDYRRHLWRALVSLAPRALSFPSLHTTLNADAARERPSLVLHPLAGVSVTLSSDETTLRSPAPTNTTTNAVTYMDLRAFTSPGDVVPSVLDAMLSGYAALTKSADFDFRIYNQISENDDSGEKSRLSDLRGIPNMALCLIARAHLLSSLSTSSSFSTSDARASAPVWLARIAAAIGPRPLLDLMLANDQSPYTLLLPLHSIAEAIAAAKPTAGTTVALPSAATTTATTSTATNTDTTASPSPARRTLQQRLHVLESALAHTSACGEAEEAARTALQTTIAVMKMLV